MNIVAHVLAAVALVASARAVAQPTDGTLDPFLKETGRDFVLENAWLIDGSGGPVRDAMTIHIRDGRIAYVGKPLSNPPAGTRRIDLTGHTVLPGLVMMHEHINYFSGQYVWDAQPGSVPKLLLAAGVTTARTAGSEAPQVDINLKGRIDAGLAPGPRLFVTGAYLNGAKGGFLGDTVVSSHADGREVTAYWAARGATSVKAYSDIPIEALRGAVDEANRRGIHVAGHLGETSCTAAANAGIHTIEHSLTSCAKDLGIAPEAFGTFRYDPTSEAARNLVALLVSKRVVMIATPPPTEPYQPTPEELSMLSPDQRERYDQMVKSPPPWILPKPALLSWNEAHRAFERDFVKAGGRLLIGADASDFGLVPGYANHNAIIALVRAGFRPEQVFRFATKDAADFLGIGADRGSVTIGRWADLVIVKGAPDQRIEDVRNVTIVFKDGLAFDPVKLRAASKGLLGQH